MKVRVKRKCYPLWFVCTISALLVLGWACFFFICIQYYQNIDKLTGNNEDKLLGTLLNLLFGLSNSIFIALTVGIFTEAYLKVNQEEKLKYMISKCNIEHIYPSRTSAAKDFIRNIHRKRTTEIYIVGISLRDFWSKNGEMRDLWLAICERMEKEYKKRVPSEKRLKVRLLLLDPRSSEGHFRHNVEKETMKGNSFDKDVLIGQSQVLNARNKIFNGNPSEYSDYLELRFYEHCPYGFQFLSDTDVYIEQYDYRDHSNTPSLPLIRYSAGSLQYKELEYSIKKVLWNNASPKLIDEHQVGTARSIRDCKIEAIFNTDQIKELEKEIIESISSAKDPSICILSDTGHLYTEGIIFERILQRAQNDFTSNVKIVVMNPTSQQAILQAIAEEYGNEEIKNQICTWTWEKHKKSQMILEIFQTISAIEYWINKKRKFELRLSSGVIFCELCIIQDKIFIEQNSYGGGNRRFVNYPSLKAEYPVLEYNIADLKQSNSQRIEHETMGEYFRVLWEAYSISLEEYNQMNNKEHFNKNLEMLLREINCERMPA